MLTAVLMNCSFPNSVCIYKSACNKGIPQNKIISEFYSNDDLYECCKASATIPFITERYGLRRFRGELVADGSFTNDLPVFKDQKRRQLVFDLGELEYSVTRRMTASGK